MKFSALITVLAAATIATALPAGKAAHTLEKRACKSTTLNWVVQRGSNSVNLNIFELWVTDGGHGTIELYSKNTEAFSSCESKGINFCVKGDGVYHNDKITMTYNNKQYFHNTKNAVGPWGPGVMRSTQYWNCVE
ncbi:hypothetical protein BGZ59_011098 [Podila verticillata]|nr:hypothetical protein BGZ59_011098 [Podila verticillata]